MPKGKRIVPLDIDELERNPSLIGMLSFRDVPVEDLESRRADATSPPAPEARAFAKKPIGVTPTGRPPIAATATGLETKWSASSGDLGAAEPLAALTPAGPTPTGTATLPSAAGGMRSGVRITRVSAPTGLAPIGAVAGTLQLEDVLAELRNSPVIPKTHGKVLKAERVEDGHSATQNALYWYLWRAGRQVKDSRSRFIQAGYGQLQAAIGVDRSNIQDALRELQKKLSIRVVQASTVGSATVYEVVCCEEILACRQQQGMNWVRRYGTRRADFIPETEVLSHTNDHLAPTGAKPIGSAPPGLAPPGFRPPVGVTPTEAVGLTPIHSVKGVIKARTSSTATDPGDEQAITAIEERILKTRFSSFDRLAIQTIWEQSREALSDVTPEEVFLLFEEKAKTLSGNKKVENLSGLLLYAWEGFCTPGRLQQLRQRRKQQQEEDERERQEMIRTYRACLEDSDEKVRQMARDGLKSLGADREGAGKT